MNILMTIFNGALGALTFGIYHHIISMRQIEEHNKKIMSEIKYFKKSIAKL
jgi:hypothetical protein